MSSRSAKLVDIAPSLPSDIEAERTILGAIMLDNKYLDEASSLKESDFSSEQHRIIFNAMNQMFETGETIDTVTLPSRLRGSGTLGDVGGAAYIARLPIGLPRITNVTNYVSIVRRQSMSRQIIQISNLAQQLAFTASDSPEEIADQALKQFMDLTTEYAANKILGKTSTESKTSFLKSLEEKENLLRVNTGLTELDKATGGFRAGELVTITASVTGSGKTLFAQQIRANACKAGLHGVYFSGEMLAEQLSARELATEAGVPHWKIRRPERLEAEEYTALCSVETCQKCRTVDGDFSIRDIRIACRRMKRAGDLSWAVIDYDELVEAPGKDEFAQQRHVIREAKRLAMTLEIPVIMISGIRKPSEKGDAKKPKLEQVYGSGSKSKHSTYVLFIDRAYVREMKGEDTGEAIVYILKSRNGKIGKIAALFNRNTLRFENVSDGKGTGGDSRGED